MGSKAKKGAGPTTAELLAEQTAALGEIEQNAEQAETVLTAIGEAVADGDDARASRLQAQLAELDGRRTALHRKATISSAALEKAREHETRDELEAVGKDLADIARRWPEVGERLSLAIDAVVDAWREHEAVFAEYSQVERRLNGVAARVKRYKMPLEVPARLNMMEMLGLPQTVLHDVRLLSDRRRPPREWGRAAAKRVLGHTPER